MSAIFGIYHLDDCPASRVGLEKMARLLAHRGPDGSAVWCDGQVGLGHLMLHTTSQSLAERLPLKDPIADLVITADARLDNRKELVSVLGHYEPVSNESSDGELILAAYRHWGEQCTENLLGDFAFAIWDARRRTLFCARDHFGVRPFYYYQSPGRAFVFATEMKALFALPDVPCELNELRVADHLSEIFKDHESTFYGNIVRLAPAHTLTVSRKEVRTSRYWALDPSRELRLSSSQEYAEGFREVFTEAVRSRMNSISGVGSMLSGGLDSSSISCVAREFQVARGQRLQTFSSVFEKVPRCDEREYINSVIAQGGIVPHFVSGDQNGPFQDIERIHWHEDQAFYAPNFAMVWSIYKSVQSKDVRVLLDGHDGDSVVSHGYKYLDELAIAGRWLTLTREVRSLAKHNGESPVNALRAYGSHYRIKPLLAKHGSLRMARRMWNAVAPARNEVNKGEAKTGDWRDVLNPEFAQRTNMAERYKAFRKTLSNSARTEREAHYRILSQPLQAFALEVHDNAAAALSIEKRYPFWDRRVVEFCLSLPPEQKLHRGWTRIVMRRAMEGILPTKIQWRADKVDFSPSLSHGLLSFERDLLDRIILQDSSIIEQYVNINSLRSAYRRLLADECDDSVDLLNVWKCAAFALWLKQARPA